MRSEFIWNMQRLNLCAVRERYMLTIVRPPSTHRATVLSFQTKADHTIGIISILFLAILTRNVSAVAPTGVVAISTLRVETWSLRAAFLLSLCAKHPQKLL